MYVYVMYRYGEILYPDGSLNVMTSVAGQIKKPGKGNTYLGYSGYSGYMMTSVAVCLTQAITLLNLLINFCLCTF